MICGVVQSDWWWLDLGKNICRCNACMRQGLTKQEDRLEVILDGGKCYRPALNFAVTGEVYEIM